MPVEWTDLSQVMEQLQDRYHLCELLQWDQAAHSTVNRQMRSRQEALATRDHHVLLTSGTLHDMLTGIDRSQLNQEQIAMIRVLEREHEVATRVPADLEAEIAANRVGALQAWQLARYERRFAHFAPVFQRVVELAIARAQAIGFGAEPLDACLNEYEPGLTAEQASQFIKRLDDEVQPLIQGAQEIDDSNWSLPVGNIDVSEALQSHFLELCGMLGFDERKGLVWFGPEARMLDVGPGAIRLFLPRRIEELTGYVRILCHETGHALYEQGLPARWSATPIGKAPSIAFHEALAAFWENHVARSQEFWLVESAHLRRLIPDLADTQPDQFYRACNRVRVQEDVLRADEITYVAQIAIRFEIERRILNGDLRAAEVPEAFRALLVARLGIEPSSDQVYLQDLQWPYGNFGYLPTYLYGRAYAACLYEAACNGMGGENRLQARVMSAYYPPINQWLRDNVYAVGATLPSIELLQELTGAVHDGQVDAEPYLRHLRRRFNDVYGAH